MEKDAAMIKELLADNEELALVKRIGGRDEDALSLLFDKFAPLLYSLLMRMLRSVEDSEDLLQELFVQFWNDQKSYHDGQEPFLIWSTGKIRPRAILRINARALKKQNQHGVRNILPLYSDSAASDNSQKYSHNISSSDIIEGLKQLSDDEQQVLALAFYDGYTESEIARQLNIPPWTIRWLLHKSLLSLSGAIAKGEVRKTEHDKRYLEACAAYVACVLEEKDLKEFEHHLNQPCPVCRAETTLFKRTVSLLPLGLPQLSISNELKERVFFTARLSEVVKSSLDDHDIAPPENVIHEPEKGAEDKHAKGKISWVTVAIILTAVVIIVIAYQVLIRPRMARSQYETYEQARYIERLTAEIEHKNEILGLLENKDLIIIPLSSAKSNLGAYGKLFWDDDNRIAAIQVSNLPTIPEDKNYQVWYKIKDSIVSGGTFAIKRQMQGENFFMLQVPSVKDISEISGLEITLELKGDQTKPAGDLLLIGKISSDKIARINRF